MVHAFSFADVRQHNQTRMHPLGPSEIRHIIVACHAWYGDLMGGSFRLASEFAEYLANLGCRVSFVCSAQTTNQEVQLCETVRGVNVYRYRLSGRRLSGLGRLLYHVNQTKALVKQVANDHPVTALSAHSPLQSLGAANALHGKGTFINYTVHSPFDDELLSNVDTSSARRMGLRLAAIAARWVDRANLKFADRVQTDSQYTLTSLINKHGEWIRSKAVVAPGWVDNRRFQPASDRPALRRDLGPDWQTDGPLLFTLRRLENRMGLDTLVNACQEVIRRGGQFRMLIGGGGPLHGSLQEMIEAAQLQNHVRLLGRIPEDDLARCYAAADCFVLPTRALECFGLIVLEAFACNTPVIASAAAAIPELAALQGSDWMFEPGNQNQLADRMLAFLERRLARKMCLLTVAKQFDKPKVLNVWESLLLRQMPRS